MTKQRLTYIDTAKGLLILLMIWYHTPPAVARFVEGCNPYMGGEYLIVQGFGLNAFSCLRSS